LFECVINVSEGRRLDVLDELSRAAGASLRDHHSDAVHNRSVFTLIHERDALRSDVRNFVGATMENLDLHHHAGVHPRFGVLDVVPFVALDDAQGDKALALRDETASWVAERFHVPVYLYGPLDDGSTRTLPEVRREAFRTLMPDFGPDDADPALGASAIGARGVLVAWNIWVRDCALEDARAIAKAIRRLEVRALAFTVGDFVQISCNLIQPNVVGPSVVYDEVQKLLKSGVIDHAELVGLVPESVLRAEDSSRWAQLGLSEATTIETRLAR
jgi:glutamate formiminotransferase